MAKKRRDGIRLVEEVWLIVRGAKEEAKVTISVPKGFKKPITRWKNSTGAGIYGEEIEVRQNLESGGWTVIAKLWQDRESDSWHQATLYVLSKKLPS
jgi:hypothetical protein